MKSFFSINLSNFYLFKVESIAVVMLYLGILFGFFGTLHPWFMWPLDKFYMFISGAFVFLSMLCSNKLTKGIYSNRLAIAALVAYIILSYYQCIVNGDNVKGLFANIFRVITFAGVLMLPHDRLEKIVEFLAKSMGLLLAVSLSGFLFILLGIHIPSAEVDYQDGTYEYFNYYFFLVNINDFRGFPRFSSVFIEPGYLGATVCFLLMNQKGKWKKWYNVMMIIAGIITFSLTFYILFVAICFMHLWLDRKAIIMKGALLCLLVLGVVGLSLVYNDGDNFVNDLILSRLEMNDGELEGNDREAADFEGKFNRLISSSDIFFGRDVAELDWGNSGARVYVYDFGIVGLFLVMILYFYTMITGSDRRAIICASVLSFLIFLTQGNPIWLCYYLPLYSASCMKPNSKQIWYESPVCIE